MLIFYDSYNLSIFIFMQHYSCDVMRMLPDRKQPKKKEKKKTTEAYFTIS